MHSIVGSLLSTRLVSKGIRILYSALASHSVTESHSFPKMNVSVLSALEDNYMYLISDEATKSAAVIDPVNPDKVLEEVKKLGLNLTAVLTTHHHWDHAGGNEDLVKKVGSIDVYGGDERVKAVTNIVKHGDTLSIGNLKVKCLFTPCHTIGHICYLVSSDSQPSAVFTGDTLFIAGCGRFFEGTPDQMYKALCEVLYELPDDTKVFCGHEYTITNLKFALTVDPTNEDVKNKLKWAEEKRKAQQPTVPSSIGEEKKTNPFMRVNQLMEHSTKSSAIALMGTLRKEKDSFKA